MTDPNKNNNAALLQQDDLILEAIFDGKQTLTEYAAANGITRDEAESCFEGALRRRKTALTFIPSRYAPPDGGELPRQGFRVVPRSRQHSKPQDPLYFLDLDDLDAWLEIE